MANRLNSGIAYLLCSLVVLQPTLGDQLDSDCIKRYSMSYKRPAKSNHKHAEYAVDDDETTCSKTIKSSNDSQSWWQVELDVKTNVSMIQIKNSRQHPTALRVYVRKDAYSEGKACPTKGYHVFAGGETRIIRCDPMLEGRAIRIVGKEFNDFLSLCEVQVFNDSVLVTEGVTYEVWFNVTTNRSKGYYFINSKAQSSGILATFQSPRDISDHYGVRMKTYFNPPANGSYLFNMSGDNKCTLYIKDVIFDKRSTIIGKIPRAEKLPVRTAYDVWNESYVVPVPLIKGRVYEIVGLMYEVDKKDHLRVGITYPNGTFVGPMDSRIFINKRAARTLTKNSCSQLSGTIRPSFPPPTKAPAPNTEEAITSDMALFRSNMKLGKTKEAITIGVALVLSNKTDDKTKFQILNVLDKFGLEIAKNLTLGKKPYASYVEQVDGFVFAAVSLGTRYSFHFPGNLDNFRPTAFSNQGSIRFPKGAFSSGKERVSIVFMMFRPLQEMLNQTGQKQNHLSNIILSATIEAGFPSDKIKPFTLGFKTTQVCIKNQRHCVFWIEDSQSKHDAKFGRWSDEGCSLVYKNETHATCRCNHLTKFAVLFPFAEVGSKEEEMNIELITYVGLSLSSIGCFITFAVYLILRITKTLKTVVHLNLVLALGLADLVFLLGNLAETNKNLCLASTILSFYLYLAVFAWMLMEGVHLYFLVIRVFGSDDHHRKMYYHIIGWGVPLVIVTVTAGILRYDLMSEKYCWLSTRTASIWVFVGPALFVIIVNILILGAVLRTTMTLLRNDPGHRKEKSAMRTLAMLVPILGTTWVFGVVAFANDSIVFQYIFAACNAFQGFFIFILYCLFNTEVRREYQRRRKAWRTERELDSKRLPQNNSFDL